MVDFYFTAVTMCPDCRAQEYLENIDVMATTTVMDMPCAFCGKTARCSVVLMHGTEDLENATQRMGSFALRK